MKEPENLAGKRFGMLVAGEFVGKRLSASTRRSQPMWMCRCDCGGSRTVGAWVLKSGKTTNCGCAKHAGRSASMVRRHKEGSTGFYSLGEASKKKCRDSILRFAGDPATVQRGHAEKRRRIEQARADGTLEPLLKARRLASGMPDHCGAKAWEVRDPYGLVHRFSNLSLWCQRNESLFLDDYPDSVNPFWRRVAGGFSSLAAVDGRKTSYKGWVLVSNSEKRGNNAADILKRRK